MSWLAIALAAIWLVGLLRSRSHAARLPVLEPPHGPGDEDCVFLTAEGVTLDEETRAAACACVRERGIDAIDLVPADLPAEWLGGFLSMIDPGTSTVPFARDQTARCALVVSPLIAARAGVHPTAGLDPVEITALARRLKAFALRGLEHVVAPRVKSNDEDVAWRMAVHRESLGGIATVVLVLEILMIAALWATLALAPRWGLLPLAVYHLTPAGTVLGTRLWPRDLPLSTLLRSVLATWLWLATVLGPRKGGAGDEIEERRPLYAELIKDGIDRFFEPRRETCPLCAGRRLERFLEAPDMFQHKPGRFVLERCADCGHIFQNPRLSIAGLDFYYKDFYDGLGQRQTETVFGIGDKAPYQARARMVNGHAQPGAWLDVGGGYGHFCLAARELWPGTRFDVLDLSDGVLEAKRRGWADEGYRGLFPEICGQIPKYDVVSMSHYLEHTRDPEAEVTAAATALKPGGLLLIEVPNGEAAVGRLLRRYWLPYFQPQHQHMLSTTNLGRMLERHGFEPLVWHVGEAHGGGDFVGAAYLFVKQVAGPASSPWLPRRSLAQRARYRLSWLLLCWLVPAGALLDKILERSFRRPGRTNAFRVLARKRSPAATAAAGA
jgi:SAM-dependent methyltransferase